MWDVYEELFSETQLTIIQPGFDSMREGLRPDGLMVDVVRVKLTQSLGLVTDDVVEEAAYSIDAWFGDSKAWTTYEPKSIILDIVARVSTRVFAGTDLARNKVNTGRQYSHERGEGKLTHGLLGLYPHREREYHVLVQGLADPTSTCRIPQANRSMDHSRLQKHAQANRRRQTTPGPSSQEDRREGRKGQGHGREAFRQNCRCI